jgi:plastocyanin
VEIGDGEASAAGAGVPAHYTVGRNPRAGVATVTIASFRYSPRTIRLRSGGEVRWVNADAVSHTATGPDGDGFDTGTLGPGEAKSVPFRDTGRFSYTCSLHPFMKGTVVVD